MREGFREGGNVELRDGGREGEIDTGRDRGREERIEGEEGIERRIEVGRD